MTEEKDTVEEVQEDVVDEVTEDIKEPREAPAEVKILRQVTINLLEGEKMHISFTPEGMTRLEMSALCQQAIAALKV